MTLHESPREPVVPLFLAGGGGPVLPSASWTPTPTLGAVRTRLAKPGKGKRAKLSPGDVRAIQAKRRAGATFTKLVDEYGVSRRTIQHAVAGVSWAEFDGKVKAA